MLLTDDTKKIFNTTEIHRGTIVYAKHQAWNFGVTGTVVETSAVRLRIEFLPAIQNVVNHLFVPVEEVAAGLWELRYSNDGMATVSSYPEPETDPETEPETDPETGQGTDSGTDGDDQEGGGQG